MDGEAFGTAAVAVRKRVNQHTPGERVRLTCKCDFVAERNRKMKRIMTAFAVCAALALTSSAVATSGIWDGTDSGSSPTTSWSDGYAWSNSASSQYPKVAADTATIDDRYSPPVWPVLDTDRTIGWLVMHDIDVSASDSVQINTSSYTLTVDTLFEVSDTNSACYAEQLGSGEIDAPAMKIIAGDDDDEHVVFELSGGTLDVHGTVLVQAAESDDADATIQIGSGTTFTPEAMAFEGSSDPNYGYAIGTFNESVSVSCCTSVMGCVNITIAESEALDLNTVSLDGNGTDLTVTGGGNGATLDLACLVDNGQPTSFDNLTVNHK